jgi:hypothetical protein
MGGEAAASVMLLGSVVSALFGGATRAHGKRCPCWNHSPVENLPVFRKRSIFSHATL